MSSIIVAGRGDEQEEKAENKDGLSVSCYKPPACEG